VNDDAEGRRVGAGLEPGEAGVGPGIWIRGQDLLPEPWYVVWRCVPPAIACGILSPASRYFWAKRCTVPDTKEATISLRDSTPHLGNIWLEAPVSRSR
jgi:hypothetical protein